MGDITLSLVIPTVGRPTLARALTSLRGQAWAPGDEVLLVGDGPQPVARELWPQFGLPGRYLETPRQLGRWGHGVRNWVIAGRLAAGTHCAALDDDDEYTPGAVAAMRAAIAAAPDRPHLFRMDWRNVGGKVLWESPDLRVGNVSTVMFTYPNDPHRLGTWGDRYEGDFDFIAGTCGHYPAGPVWRPEVVAVCRPHLRDDFSRTPAAPTHTE